MEERPWHRLRQYHEPLGEKTVPEHHRYQAAEEGDSKPHCEHRPCHAGSLTGDQAVLDELQTEDDVQKHESDRRQHAADEPAAGKVVSPERERDRHENHQRHGDAGDRADDDGHIARRDDRALPVLVVYLGGVRVRWAGFGRQRVGVVDGPARVGVTPGPGPAIRARRRARL